MLATDIHHELVVDEHPYVIVAQEFKVLARHIFELGLNGHGEAVVVISVSVFFRKDAVVVRVRNRLRRIQVLEIIQQEHAAVVEFVPPGYVILVYFGKPESCAIQRNIQVAAGTVGQRVAIGVDGQGFRNEPVVQVFGVFAVFGEGICSDGNAVGTKFRLDHAFSNSVAVVLFASTGTEVLAGGSGF